MNGFFSGVALTGVGASTFRFTDSNLATSIPGGYGVTISTSSNGVDIVLENLFILGPTTGTQPLGGVVISNAGDITLSHVSTVHMGAGLSVSPATGQTVQALFVHDSMFDSGSSTGVNLSPSGSGSIQLEKFVNVWSATNVNGFVLGGNASGTVLRSEFINCTGSNNTTTGLYINGSTVTNTSIVGGSFSANTNGISVATASGRFSISGVKSGPAGQFSANSSYGLNLAGTLASFMVMNNDFSGNTTGAILAATYTGTEGH